MITRYCRRLVALSVARARSCSPKPLSPLSIQLSLSRARARARAPCHSRLSELDKHSHLSIYIITLDHVTLQPLFSVSSHYCLSSLSPHTTASLHCFHYRRTRVLPPHATTTASVAAVAAIAPLPSAFVVVVVVVDRLARTGRDHRLRKQAFFFLLI